MTNCTLRQISKCCSFTRGDQKVLGLT